MSTLQKSPNPIISRFLAEKTTRLFCRTLGVAALLWAVAAPAADFESGDVQRSEAAGLYLELHPPSGEEAGQRRPPRGLRCAHLQRQPPRPYVYGSLPADGGRNWSAARLLIQDALKADGDPNIVVDGNRTLVISSRANVPNKIDKSWFFMISSADFGRSWSVPMELVVPRQYMAGKQHNGIKLRDGTLMVGVSWDKWPEMGMAARTEGEMDLTTGVLLSKDGRHWTLHGAIHAYVEKEMPGSTNGLCEPSLVELDNGQVLMILRSGSSHHTMKLAATIPASPGRSRCRAPFPGTTPRARCGAWTRTRRRLRSSSGTIRR